MPTWHTIFWHAASTAEYSTTFPPTVLLSGSSLQYVSSPNPYPFSYWTKDPLNATNIQLVVSPGFRDTTSFSTLSLFKIARVLNYIQKCLPEVLRESLPFSMSLTKGNKCSPDTTIQHCPTMPTFNVDHRSYSYLQSVFGTRKWKTMVPLYNRTVNKPINAFEFC